jgi:hypothetical protein
MTALMHATVFYASGCCRINNGTGPWGPGKLGTAQTDRQHSIIAQEARYPVTACCVHYVLTVS